MELVDGTVYRYSPVPGNIVDIFLPSNIHCMYVFRQAYMYFKSLRDEWQCPLAL